MAPRKTATPVSPKSFKFTSSQQVRDWAATKRKNGVSTPSKLRSPTGLPPGVVQEIKSTKGRPSVLTLEFQERFVKVLRRGHYVHHACDLIGVTPRLVWEWMKRGELEVNQGLDSEPHAQFLIAVKEATAIAIDSSLRKIRRGERNWQAQAWFLERKNPNEYGPKTRIEHTGAEGGPIETKQQLDLSRLSVQELINFRNLLSKAEKTEEESQ